jgi:hypothetical protein
MAVSEKVLEAAHDAWEDATNKWHIVHLRPYYIVESRPTFVTSEAPTEDEVAFYRFADEATAKFCLRDLILKAIIEAVEKTKG